MPFNTIAEIEEANRRAGYHWFDADTMRFFQGRVLDGVSGGCFFVSSERYRAAGNRRGYTVRYATDDGRIHTASDMQQHARRQRAKSQAREFANGREVPRDAYDATVNHLRLTGLMTLVFKDGLNQNVFTSESLHTDYLMFFQHDACRAVNIIHSLDYAEGSADRLLAEIARTADHVKRERGLL